MTDLSLPTPADLMLPVLKAAKQVGGKARYEDIDHRATEIAQLSTEQMAVEFPDDSSHRGPKVLYRTAWARSMLKRIGALESHGAGVWGITGQGLDYLATPDDEADTALRDALPEAFRSKEPSEAELGTWKESADRGSPLTMTARELIGLWGVGRRSSSVNTRINESLAEYGLRTEPNFMAGGLDQAVGIVLTDATVAEEVILTPVASTLAVGNLPSATAGVVSVTHNDELLKAQTLMWTNDYSQLAVMTGRHDIKGAISWESIARARLRNPNASLKDCIEEPVEVNVGTPLLEAVPLIAESEFFFVRAADRSVCGIVTSMDLSDQFALLAGPFLILSEIEQLFRVALDQTFTRDEMSEVVSLDDDRVVDGSHSLTLGEVQRLVEEPSRWDRIGWPADRRVFIKALDEVREIRNEIMHFSPDPLEEERLHRLKAFLEMMRDLVVP